MSSPSPRDRADSAYSLVLQKLPHGAATRLAREMGVSDKDFSHIKNDFLAPSLYLLAHLGFKVVPASARCLTPVAYAFLTDLQERIARKAPSLQWDDSELGATKPGELGE